MKFYGCLLALFFICSSLMYTEMSAIATFAIAGIMIMVLFLTILLKRKNLTFNVHLLVLFYIFVVTCGISSLMNMDINLLKSDLNFLIVYASLVIVLPNLLKNDPSKIITRSYLIGIMIPIIGIPLLKDGFNTSPYMGIFSNPNAMGLISATTFAMLFALLLYCVLAYLQDARQVKKLYLLFLLGLSLLLMYITILTASRTSVIACAVIVGIGVLLVFKNVLTNLKRYRNLIFKLMFIVLLVFLASYVLPIKETLQENILNKFQVYNTDTLNGRGDAWAQTIADSRLFGRGDAYFSEYTSITSHNTYINILGRYGWVPLICFILFLLKSLHLCYQYTKNENRSARYAPLFGIITFIILSMGESIMLNLGMLLMFALVGSASIPQREIDVVKFLQPHIRTSALMKLYKR